MKIVDPKGLMKGSVDLPPAQPVEPCGVLDDLRRVRTRLDLVEVSVAPAHVDEQGERHVASVGRL
jgi:hypothetical protein